MMTVQTAIAPPAAATEKPISLTPAQRLALEELERLVAITPCVGLVAPLGSGKSEILRQFAERNRAAVIGPEDCLDRLKIDDPELGMEAIIAFIENVAEYSDLIVFDDFSRLLLQGSVHQYNAPFAMKYLLERLAEWGKTLVFGSRLDYATQGQAQVVRLTMAPFAHEDYQHIIEHYLGEHRAAGIDLKLVLRYLSAISFNELRLVCSLLETLPQPTTEDFLRVLGDHVVIANTRTHEVENITFDKLPGAEKIVSKLETHIILPLENLALARDLDIRPKRGVLLYGPPGTGKTSIGRALAHRMKGKFFLIDGSITTEPPAIFFGQISAIVKEARENSPSVLFIDDADVLFGIEHISGFGRYLLTLLDGMESESAGKVCLMMTAMDVRKVPDAILRSGRVELWLETRPPVADVRARILERWVTPDLPEADRIDYASLAERTDNFTPADLRRIVGDARTYLAADTIAGRAVLSAQAYLERAVDTIVATRARMADSLRDESLRVGMGETAPRAKYGRGIGGLAAASANCQTKLW